MIRALAFLLASAACIAAGPGTESKPPIVQTAPVTLKVAAVQFRSSFDVADNRKRITAWLEKLAAQGVRVAAFPECALTGYHAKPVMEASTEDVRAAEAEIGRTCARLRISAVVGSIYRVNGKTFNTAVVFNAQGELVERYGKLMLAGEKWATPGNHIAFFDLEGVPSTVIVCHDERYPEFVRIPAMAGARLVYYISHESGMKAESKLAPYRAQMMARAVENGVYVVAANAPANADKTGSHGQSRIIAADGNILKEASIYDEDALIETITVKPGTLARPLQGVTGEWWRGAVGRMLDERSRPLE